MIPVTTRTRRWTPAARSTARSPCASDATAASEGARITDHSFAGAAGTAASPTFTSRAWLSACRPAPARSPPRTWRRSKEPRRRDTYRAVPLVAVERKPVRATIVAGASGAADRRGSHSRAAASAARGRRGGGRRRAAAARSRPVRCPARSAGVAGGALDAVLDARPRALRTPAPGFDAAAACATSRAQRIDSTALRRRTAARAYGAAGAPGAPPIPMLPSSSNAVRSSRHGRSGARHRDQQQHRAGGQAGPAAGEVDPGAGLAVGPAGRPRGRGPGRGRGRAPPAAPSTSTAASPASATATPRWTEAARAWSQSARAAPRSRPPPSTCLAAVSDSVARRTAGSWHRVRARPPPPPAPAANISTSGDRARISHRVDVARHQQLPRRCGVERRELRPPARRQSLASLIGTPATRPGRTAQPDPP